MHKGRLTTRGDPLSYAALRDPAAPREEATGHRLQVRCGDPPCLPRARSGRLAAEKLLPTAYAWGLGLRTSLGASPAAQAE